MALQRHFFQVTKQYISRHCLLQSNIRQSYCELCCKYSSSKESRKFNDRHEWVVVNNDIGTVGISNYAQEALGDVVFAQLPDPGTKLIAGNECGALESVKAASEIYSPVTGIVTEKNEEVEKMPSLINNDCYSKGWLYKVKLTNLKEIEELMSQENYETYLKGKFLMDPPTTC